MTPVMIGLSRHKRRALAHVLAAALASATIAALHMPAAAQQNIGWPVLDQLLFSTLTRSGTAEASFWLPDNIDPALATRALGVVYEHIQGSAGNTTIAVGLYGTSDVGWQFVGKIDGLFGNQPREAVFGPTSVELTTTTLGPDEPRCCPTQITRWRIDMTTLRALPLN